MPYAAVLHLRIYRGSFSSSALGRARASGGWVSKRGRPPEFFCGHVIQIRSFFYIKPAIVTTFFIPDAQLRSTKIQFWGQSSE